MVWDETENRRITGKNVIYPGYQCENLTVLTFVDKHPHKGHKWLCQCVCGKTIEVYAYLLNHKNKKHTKSCGCKHLRHKHTKDISGTFFSHKKWSAKTRNIEFNVSIEDLQLLLEKQNYKCAISGIELTTTLGKKYHSGTISIDRIDSTKGYLLDNIQLVHKDINFMKYTLSQDRFIELAHIISEFQRNKK